MKTAVRLDFVQMRVGGAAQILWHPFISAFLVNKRSFSSKMPIIRTLTLFTPAYFGISGTRGGHIVPPLSILGLGGVRVPILFGNDLPMND